MRSFIAAVLLSSIALPVFANPSAQPSTASAVVDSAARLEDPIVVPASALDRYSLSVGMTSFGPAVEAGYRFSPRLGLRATVGGFDLSGSGEIDGEEIDGKLSGRGLGVIGDFRPTGGALRLSGGIFYADYSASLTASRVSFDSGLQADLDLKVDTRQNIMPMLGIGLDGSLLGPLTGTVGIGALFGDGFDVVARENTGLVSQAEIDAEISDISKTLRDLKVIPFIQVSIGMRF